MEKEKSRVGQLAQDPNTGKALAYIGRDGLIYPLRENGLHLIKDGEGSHPLTILLLLDGFIKEKTHATDVTKEQLRGLGFEVEHLVYENGHPHPVN